MLGAECKLFVVCLLAGLIECNRDICGAEHFLKTRGAISSPLYPRSYPDFVECSWTILIPPDSQLTVFLVDLDIQEDADCEKPPCCHLNHLSLPSNGNETLTNYCGLHRPKGPLHLKKNKTIIKYRSSKENLRSRGFNLTYIITPGYGRNAICQDDEFRCHNRVCLPESMRCDGKIQCIDGSDERGCSTYCSSLGKVPCDLAGSTCYDNRTQRCNGFPDCPSGIDEKGCIVGEECAHRCRTVGCYTASQRCDGFFDCIDSTDELGCGCDDGDCSGRLCIGAKKICSNAKCLHPSLWCDGNDDCGDNSDEENCIRNSMISATIMGCLFCGLMLVIAVMCALRMYSSRNESTAYRLALPQHIATRLSMANSISLPAMEDEFFHREPPPAYSVAVGQADLTMTGIVEIESSSRRSRTRRCRPSRPLVKPPTPPPSNETSNQSSPSRDSITSSSYLSNDDSAHLIESEYPALVPSCRAKCPADNDAVWGRPTSDA
ncbi:low density lipoprotein receptor-related protein 12 [Nesidiocoris tenuis]|uniref:Low density lipoprotein receptor-related protein 12 n=1 Tax=Nesidiocoris tenuis TaxID=355587 RepID=A0ABN7AG28_9HEMI|nr:low density lipoprotein receptor-related protein 12 [Nesidiocoris tenuis]